jgi:hypothetical protein
MNRSLASNTKAGSKAASTKAGSTEDKAGSRAAAGSRSRDSKVKNPDRAASTAVSKSRGKADNRVASAKASAGSCDQFPRPWPGIFLAGNFFDLDSPSASRDAHLASGRLP